jgi:hypothetical protein
MTSKSYYKVQTIYSQQKNVLLVKNNYKYSKYTELKFGEIKLNGIACIHAY